MSDKNILKHHLKQRIRKRHQLGTEDSVHIKEFMEVDSIEEGASYKVYKVLYDHENVSFVRHNITDVFEVSKNELRGSELGYRAQAAMGRVNAKEHNDAVNSPAHYTQYSRETIDTMEGMSTPEEFRGHLKLTAVKYLSRYNEKNGVQDLDKAIWYLNKLKNKLEESQ